MANFEVRIVEAGKWRRLDGTQPAGKSGEARPHIVPLSSVAKDFVELDKIGWSGSSGLCPGEITLDGQNWVLAYRFLPCAEQYELEQVIVQLDKACLDVFGVC